MEKVIAVIVTYNRKELLAECITALRNQSRKPDAILVINNGSTDDTEQWLQTQTDVQVITQKNSGSGGGFSTGIQWAFANGYSWIWCMDDDGYPKQDALEKLLEPETKQIALRNCAVINKNDKKTFVWRTKNYATIDDVDCNVIEGVGHPFNGTLIHRNIVERVGAPRPGLFLWGDESEYFCRITKKNRIPVITVASSIHYHPASAFTYKSDWDYKTCWKMYYYVRNRFHVHKSKFGNKLMAFINYCGFLLAMIGVVVVFQKTDKMKKLGFIFWPAADAFTNNLSVNPQMIMERLNDGKPVSVKNVLHNQVRAIGQVLQTPPVAVRDRKAARA
ncbi:MAG TPA: glycosyltransferase [Ferruginibacter sp.]|nr:glycosyltransferase [Ferruginibacter sp.]HMP19450.1 glycosyltransferase [Ferruginibacter sp.]